MELERHNTRRHVLNVYNKKVRPHQKEEEKWKKPVLRVVKGPSQFRRILKSVETVREKISWIIIFEI